MGFSGNKSQPGNEPAGRWPAGQRRHAPGHALGKQPGQQLSSKTSSLTAVQILVHGFPCVEGTVLRQLRSLMGQRFQDTQWAQLSSHHPVPEAGGRRCEQWCRRGGIWASHGLPSVLMLRQQLQSKALLNQAEHSVMSSPRQSWTCWCARWPKAAPEAMLARAGPGTASHQAVCLAGDTVTAWSIFQHSGPWENTKPVHRTPSGTCTVSSSYELQNSLQGDGSSWAPPLPRRREQAAPACAGDGRPACQRACPLHEGPEELMGKGNSQRACQQNLIKHLPATAVQPQSLNHSSDHITGPRRSGPCPQEKQVLQAAVQHGGLGPGKE